jgi:hypothetical protein
MQGWQTAPRSAAIAEVATVRRRTVDEQDSNPPARVPAPPARLDSRPAVR